MTMASDTKPGLFSNADVERALATFYDCEDWDDRPPGVSEDDSFPADTRRDMNRALNATLSPAARRVLEAAVNLSAAYGKWDLQASADAGQALEQAALIFGDEILARPLTEGTETNGGM